MAKINLKKEEALYEQNIIIVINLWIKENTVVLQQMGRKLMARCKKIRPGAKVLAIGSFSMDFINNLARLCDTEPNTLSLDIESQLNPTKMKQCDVVIFSLEAYRNLLHLIQQEENWPREEVYCVISKSDKISSISSEFISSIVTPCFFTQQGIIPIKNL